MRLAEPIYVLILLPILMSLAGCGPSGERSAQRWIIQHAQIEIGPMPPPVPELIDTPPATYASHAFDPFSPERLTARNGGVSKTSAKDVLFPEANLSALTIVGFITGKDSTRVAIIRNGSEYRSVRRGNRISEQALQVKEVSDQGLLLAGEDMSEQQLLRNN